MSVGAARRRDRRAARTERRRQEHAARRARRGAASRCGAGSSATAGSRVALQAPDLARRTVLANVTLALAWWGVPRPSGPSARARRSRAIGAEHLRGAAPRTLSGGERRRVHLARAIAVRPDVLLLDEPFAGLDAEARANLLEDAALGAALDRPRDARRRPRPGRGVGARRPPADPDRRPAGGRRSARASCSSGRRAPWSRAFSASTAALEDGDELLLTRPAHVALDPAGPLEARVTRAVPLEDGVRLELELEHGRLYAVSPLPAPRPGDSVRVRIDGGARFPLADSSRPPQPAAQVPVIRREA